MRSRAACATPAPLVTGTRRASKLGAAGVDQAATRSSASPDELVFVHLDAEPGTIPPALAARKANYRHNLHKIGFVLPKSQY